jgi:hypothetical protein
LSECGVLFCVKCVICVLCLIVVPLPPGKNSFAVKINNNNNNFCLFIAFSFGELVYLNSCKLNTCATPL